MSAFETKINEIEGRLGAVESTSTTTAASTEDLISEMNDQSKWGSNLMLFSVSESTNSQINAKIAHDRELITNLFKTVIPGLVSYNFTFVKAEKNAGKVRPIKVILKNFYDVSVFIYKLNGKKNTMVDDRLKNVALSKDRTDNEQKYLNGHRDELKHRVDNGETNLTIKYCNGLLFWATLVPKPPCVWLKESECIYILI